MIGRPRIDTTGQRFGKLLVLEDRGETCLCQCDCGNTVEVKRAHMRKGHIKSCGCMKGNPTHKMTKTRLHNIWLRMKSRCYYSKDIEYKRYGARGITVCKEWRNSFETFRDWALANGYTDNLSIDRIDVNGNYEPSNCRWATVLEQACNKRNNHFLTIDGERLTLSQWQRKYGIKSSTMGNWMFRYGEDYTIEKIREHAAMCRKARM